MGTPLEAAVAGSVGAVVASLCTYPLDVVKTRLQAQRRTSMPDGRPRSPERRRAQAAGRHAECCAVRDSWQDVREHVSGPAPYKSATDCMRRIVREEGVLQLFVGLRPACGKAAATNFIFFFLLRFVRPVLGRLPLLQGIVAGTGVQLAVLPIDMVVTRLQSTRGSLKRGGFLATLVGIIRREGVRGLWSGLGPGLLLTLNPGINEMILSWLTRGRGTPTAARAFCTAAVAKAVAGTVTYPCMRAKVQMQVRSVRTSRTSAPPSTRQIMWRIVDESGFPALFDGLGPQLATSVLKEAILNMVRLKIAALVALTFRALYAVRRRRRLLKA